MVRHGLRRRATSMDGSSRSLHSSRHGPPEARSCTRIVVGVRSSARFTQRGVSATGVEPRGGVALRALERGCDVTISEIGEYLPQRSAASLGGLVLSGVVDRLPLHAILPLLAESHRALASAAPIVIVAEPLGPLPRNAPTSHDMVDRAALHLETWELLLDRSGFVDVTPLPAGTGGDERFGVSATTPAT